MNILLIECNRCGYVTYANKVKALSILASTGAICDLCGQFFDNYTVKVCINTNNNLCQNCDFAYPCMILVKGLDKMQFMWYNSN